MICHETISDMHLTAWRRTFIASTKTYRTRRQP